MCDSQAIYLGLVVYIDDCIVHIGLLLGAQSTHLNRGRQFEKQSTIDWRHVANTHIV